MKAALGVQIAEELFTSFGLRADAAEEYVNVFIDGFAIRLFLTSDRYDSENIFLCMKSESCIQLELTAKCYCQQECRYNQYSEHLFPPHIFRKQGLVL